MGENLTWSVFVRVYDIGGEDGVEEVVSDAILTAPNVLSFLRLAALPIVYMDLINGRYVRATVVLGIFSATDWLDGYVARRFNQVTKLGKLLDPFSDRLLIVAIGIGMVQADLIPFWALAILLVRDVAVLGGGIFMVAKGISPPPVTKIGKTATFGLMFALPTFILAGALGDPPGDPHHDLSRMIAWVLFLVSAALYWAAAGQYALAVRGGGDDDITEAPVTLAAPDTRR